MAGRRVGSPSARRSTAAVTRGAGRTCSLIRLPSMSTVLILKSMPIVVMNVGLNESLAYRRRRHVLPTPARGRGGEGRVVEANEARPRRRVHIAVGGVHVGATARAESAGRRALRARSRADTRASAPELPIVSSLIWRSYPSFLPAMAEASAAPVGRGAVAPHDCGGVGLQRARPQECGTGGGRRTRRLVDARRQGNRGRAWLGRGGSFTHLRSPPARRDTGRPSTTHSPQLRTRRRRHRQRSG